MKYAIRFYQGCRALEFADEIIIKYNEKNPNLIKYAAGVDQKKRLVVDCTRLEDLSANLSIFHQAKEKHRNLAIKIHEDQSAIAIDLDELLIPFFFENGVEDYETLERYVRLGVSDVYIINDFGFEIQKVSQYCHNNNVNVRVYPNVAQNKEGTTNSNSIKLFFIRPEDVEFYENYVDIFEFFGTIDKQSVLYDIYADGRWMGNLNDLILNTDFTVDNLTVVPYFGEARARCGKRCEKGKECNICGVVESLAHTLKDKNLGMLREKNKRDKSESVKKVMRHESSTINESDEEIPSEKL